MMVKSNFLILFIVLHSNINCTINNKSESQLTQIQKFTKISVINQGFFHKYPGNDDFLTAASVNPDTMFFYESDHVSIILDQAPYDDEKHIINFASRNIYVLDKITDSMFLLIHNQKGILAYAAGDSIWRTVFKKSNTNLAKSIQHIGEEFNIAQQKLVINFDTVVKPKSKEEMNLESINIQFSRNIKDDKYSISNYYDNLGYGKAVFIEFKVAPFYSKQLQKQIDAFNFFNQIIFHGKVTDGSELDFLNSIQERVASFRLK